MLQIIAKSRSLLITLALAAFTLGLAFTLRNALTATGLFGFSDEQGGLENLIFPALTEREIEAVPTTVAMVGDAADITFDLNGRGFVLDGTGAIYRLADNGSVDSIPYLVLRNKDTANFESARFTSLAFHPGYLIDDAPGFGKFYTIEPEQAGSAQPDFIPEFGADLPEHHQDVLYEYHTADPNARIFSGTRRPVLRISQPAADHNMSDLEFDRSGFLMIAVGDGGSCEPGSQSISRNAMSLANCYGKILRIDPIGNDSSNGSYGLPRRNPFRKIDDALPEIWAYGLRDPQHINYDPFRHWLSIGDIGQGDIEEINLSEKGAEHFGWDLCEGSYFYPPRPGSQPKEGVTSPLVEFAKRDARHQVRGGFVYHGNRFPVLREKLVFADSEGRLLYADPHHPDRAPREIVINSRSEFARHGITSIRPGIGGEVLVLCGNGSIYQLDKAASLTQPSRSSRPIICCTGL